MQTVNNGHLASTVEFDPATRVPLNITKNTLESPYAELVTSSTETTQPSPTENVSVQILGIHSTQPTHTTETPQNGSETQNLATLETDTTQIHPFQTSSEPQVQTPLTATENGFVIPRLSLPSLNTTPISADTDSKPTETTPLKQFIPTVEGGAIAAVCVTGFHHIRGNSSFSVCCRVLVCFKVFYDLSRAFSRYYDYSPSYLRKNNVKNPTLI